MKLIKPANSSRKKTISKTMAKTPMMFLVLRVGSFAVKCFAYPLTTASGTSRATFVAIPALSLTSATTSTFL